MTLRFQPSDLSNLSLWIDVSTSTVSIGTGSTIAQINDKSSNANHMQPRGGFTGAEYTLNNGRTAMYFADGTIAMETIANSASSGNSSRSLFLFQQTSGRIILNSGSNIFTGPGVPDRSFGLDYAPAGTQYWLPYTYGDSDNYHVDSTIPTSAALLYGFYNSSGPQDGGYFTNFTNQTTALVDLGGLNTDATPWILGNRYDGQASANSFVYELLHYDRLLSAYERQKVEGYIAWKWNTVGNLESNHPFKNSPPYATDTPYSYIRPVVGDSYIRFNWDPTVYGAAENYILTLTSPDGGVGGGTVIFGSSINTYTFSGLSYGKTYTGVLVGSNAGPRGVGISSFYRTVTTGDPPDPPTSLTYTSTLTTISFAWSEPIGAQTPSIGWYVITDSNSAIQYNTRFYNSAITIPFDNSPHTYEFQSVSDTGYSTKAILNVP